MYYRAWYNEAFSQPCHRDARIPYRVELLCSFSPTPDTAEAPSITSSGRRLSHDLTLIISHGCRRHVMTHHQRIFRPHNWPACLRHCGVKQYKVCSADIRTVRFPWASLLLVGYQAWTRLVSRKHKNFDRRQQTPPNRSPLALDILLGLGRRVLLELEFLKTSTFRFKFWAYILSVCPTCLPYLLYLLNFSEQ